MPLSADIVHALPGRVRFRLDDPALRNGSGDALHFYLANQPGIKEVRLNPACRSLLVQYDSSVWTAERLRKRLAEVALQQLQKSAKRPAHGNGLADSVKPLFTLLLSSAAFAFSFLAEPLVPLFLAGSALPI